MAKKAKKYKSKNNKGKQSEDFPHIPFSSSSSATESSIHQNSDHEEDFIPLEDPKISRQQRRFEERKQLKANPFSKDAFEGSRYNFCYPWMEMMNFDFANTETHSYDIFRQEVDCFLRYIEPTEIEMELRESIVQRISKAISKQWPDAEVSVFGSFATCLFLPNSDIDLDITFYEQNPRLDAVANSLKKAGLCDKPQVIRHATVPVIKFEELYTGLKVDIVLNTTNGVRSADLVRRAILDHPAARPLILIIKYYLAQCKLNEVYTGGLGGYAIVCLVVSFLQRHPMVATGQIDPMENISVLLLDFLLLYGIHFSMECVGIDIRGEGRYFYKELNKFGRSRNGKELFSILDPQDESNDIGSKSFEAESAADEFRYAYNVIIRKMRALEEELEANDYKQLSSHVTSSFQSCSVLSTFLYVTPEFVKQRQAMENAYEEQMY
ncbi:hypothetical protein G6F46_003447 [Rhizopus delemar]|uniref:polynucleotide adenylyltransferase n=2 Tax=Rhizopus TaxID=4842 RepID=A0A9P6Z9I7_9FUNG|nr:hypothetical protein G6F43_005977 [Rhizopus delemar]KAG1548517.1 hypothetical protein G6F51_003612 [Rhizopus arrhizus]KAG1463413.1 hypothetical protein G6F55_002403 [Rhizopus delemar]KAG1501335.1 hypothetical protein G6F54_003115 [Rhizopus delemar]KAG1515401.1 hypothetical protein G6F53_002950 [Rhizopus delemar]